ncbi:MAG TPA: hypothetical protein H9881_14860 [Candidatus Stackebrandtia excrementipullorum]|nr:hypothetical protein [Candidatus Stackebrandtia excrementipullorum]
MVEQQLQAILDVDTVDKLWSSACQQAMVFERDPQGRPAYRCGEPCRRHSANAESVKAGLLWHYRGRSATTTYGLPDDAILDDMYKALHLAWVRDGRIYTARFY